MSTPFWTCCWSTAMVRSPEPGSTLILARPARGRR
jgi:hypothetical protein